MLRITKLSIVPLIFLAAACENSGAGYQPVVDGPVGPNYNNDLAQCQSLAASQATVDGSTAAAALAGAAITGGTTAIFNNSGHNARDAAAVGAVVGAGADALQKNSDKEAIVKNCMRGRGYNVVG